MPSARILASSGVSKGQILPRRQLPILRLVLGEVDSQAAGCLGELVLGGLSQQPVSAAITLLEAVEFGMGNSYVLQSPSYQKDALRRLSGLRRVAIVAGPVDKGEL